MSTTASPSFNAHMISHVFRVSLLLLGIWLLAGSLAPAPASAQGPSLRSTQRPVRVAIDPTYQYYETAEGRVLTQLSTRLSAYVPVRERLSVRAGVDYARMGGDNLTQVRGPTDVAGAVTYAQPVGEGSVVFQLRANAPTGKQKLTGSELETTRFISQNFYDFRVSSYSRGFSVAPQVTWAVPITDKLAVGIGGGYQHQRGFQPNAELSSDSLYVPGDGIGVNGGFDYKVTDASALGLDVAFRRYGADKVDGVRQFEVGNRITGTLRYLVRSGFTTVRAVVRYAQWDESRFGFRQGSPDQAQVLPPHGMALASYRTRLVDGIRLRLRASGHWYGDTVQEDRKTFGRAYVSPSFDLGDMLTVKPHGTVTYGDYLGLGGGVRIEGTF